MKKTTRSLLLAVVVSAMLLLVCASQDEPIVPPPAMQIRAVLAGSTTLSTQSSTAVSTSTQAATSAAATSSSAAQTTPSPTPSATSKSEATSLAATTTPAPSVGQTSSSTTQAVVTSAVATTDSAGEVVTSYIQYTPTPSSVSPSPSQTSNDSSSGGGGGLSTGSIVGLSVSGGIAALAIILFFVWKFTRKRFTDFDDSEAIKWPELNAHNNDVHALPTHSTGRAGFGPENESDVNLTRAPSPGAYANSISGASVPEGYAAGDPYAVPPLPHLNPNQPYRDEPGAFGQPAGFYDPYRGPVPNTFTDNMSDGHAESIPMTQMAAGMRSPGPQMMAYDMQGRSSPAPQAAMGYPSMDERPRTPNPTALGAGRNSPSPHPGYGYGPR